MTNKKIDKIINRLNILVPLINRVHGKDHPELNTIYSNYNYLKSAIENDHQKAGELLNEYFQVSNKFKIPSDACPAYKETYSLLSSLYEMINKKINP